MKIEEALIIRLDKNLYAINAENIISILRVLPITKVPFVDNAILGLSVVKGNINTVYDFGILINNKKINQSDNKARILVLNIGESSISLLIQEVVNSVLIDESNLDIINNKDSIDVFYKYKKNIIQIVFLEKLFLNIKHISFEKKFIQEKLPKDRNTTIQNLESERYLKFDMFKEQFAIILDNIQEIIDIPKSFTSIAEAPKEVCGVMSLRDELILVIDLRIFYGLNANKEKDNQIIITECKEKKIGLLVDKIDNILNISSNQISYLSSGDGKNKINSIARTKEGIISIIDRSILEKLGDIFSNLIISPNKIDTQDDIKVKNMYEAIFFKLNNELFGFNVDKVLEILDMRELTTITQMPSFVIGIMNIRGDVVPIISTSSYIGIENNYAQIKDQKIILYDYMGVKLGFCVDEIIEVMAIDNTMIEKSQNTNIFFGDIINLKNSIALMFNTENFSYLVD